MHSIRAMSGALLALLASAVVSAATLDDVRPRFGDAVAATSYPAVSTADEPRLLRWDLRATRQVLYRLEQSEMQLTTQRLHGRSRTLERDSEAAGTLLVHARGNGKSTEVRITDVVMETTVSADGRSESATARLPVLTASGLSESGSVRGAKGAAAPSSMDNLITAMFPLPGAALRPGESDEVPVRFGAAVQWGQERGTMSTYPMVMEGRARVTLTGFERLETCECARLDITFDVASDRSPKGFPGEARVVVRGTARTWFDPQAQRMVEGSLSMLLGIELDAPDQSSGDTGMTVVTDTLTRVRLGR